MLKKIIAYGFALSCTFASQAVTQENLSKLPVKQPEVTIEQVLKQLPAEAIKAVELLRLQLKQANPSITDTQINQQILMFIQKMPLEKKQSLFKSGTFWIVVLLIGIICVVSNKDKIINALCKLLFFWATSTNTTDELPFIQNANKGDYVANDNPVSNAI